ncbi:MAG: hypothetical protein D6794_08615 [Deltaproteobacteria bacterium]|nr:MAG: hypothetical protein D6794_08615 [Deltaproteobacteria bacterium]
MTGPVTIIPGPVGAPGAPGKTGRQTPGTQPGTFDRLLRQKLDTGALKFSRHASERLQQRGLNLNASQTRRLEQAVARLEAKGGRDSLVLLDHLALVVSVDNATVVTVADQQQMKESVFTNIDSAVIA